jgi:hypothetical protein
MSDDDGGMSYAEFMSRPVPIRSDPESAARAVRYLAWWLPVGRASIGRATEDSIHTLVQFAREQLGMPASFTCPRCSRTSHNPKDVIEGYCGACRGWTGGPS